MPRGPGKKENYNLDYSRFNAFDRDADEDISKKETVQSEADAAGGPGDPSLPDMQQALRSMPPELREAFHLMQIAKENGDTVAQQRASELALKAVERGGPEVQKRFNDEVAQQMPEISGKLSADMAAGGRDPKALLQGMQEEAARHAMAQKMAEEPQDANINIKTLREQMEEGQKATHKEMEHLAAKQEELENIRGPEDFQKFMESEGLSNEDLQRIFSGDGEFMQARINETLEKKMAETCGDKGSKDSAKALDKVNELHSTLFGEDNPTEEEPVAEVAAPIRKALEAPKEPEVVIPSYRLQYQKDELGKYTMVELKCSLPGVADMSMINLDVSEKHLRLSSIAPAPRYAVNAGPFPVLIDPNGARARYSKKREELSITVPVKM